MQIPIRNTTDYFSLTSYLCVELKYELTPKERQAISKELKWLTKDLGKEPIGKKYDKYASNKYSFMYHNDLKLVAKDILLRLRK